MTIRTKLSRPVIRLTVLETFTRLEYVTRKVFVLDNRIEPLMDINRIDRDRLAGQFGRVERKLLDQPLEHGMQPPGADILRASVNLRGDFRQRRNSILAEAEMDVLGLQ